VTPARRTSPGLPGRYGVNVRRILLPSVALTARCLLLTGCLGSQVARHPGSVAPLSAGTSGQPAPGWPSRAATVRENALPGDASWGIASTGKPHQVEGYLDRASIRPGEKLHLFARSSAASIAVKVFRMGWYGGRQARLLARYVNVPVPRQPDPVMVAAATRTVSAAGWRPVLTVSTNGFPPGDYLFRLADASGAASYAPLTVRAPTTAGSVVIVNAVTTWQAYNDFGGYSLYHGPNGATATRAYAVSLDRPYSYGLGSADFFGNERPLVALAERLGLALSYVTSPDLDADPHLLDGARAVISLGHDEYWSSAMRANVTAARNQGTNVAFLGANAVYRHIRYGSTTTGPRRLEIDYKSFSLDPMSSTNPAEATGQWRDPPLPRPESDLTGTYYQCNPVKADLVVADASSWLLQGLVTDGQHLHGLLGSEFDRVDLYAPTPRPIDVLFHSPVECAHTAMYGDAAYYTTGAGSGVFDTGTSTWVCALAGQCGPGRSDGTAYQVVTEVTTRLLTAFARGPAGLSHPALDTVRRTPGILGASRQ
jgi:hypothetical protein